MIGIREKGDDTRRDEMWNSPPRDDSRPAVVALLSDYVYRQR